MSIRVVIADDHPVVRDGLRLTIERSGKDILVVGEASDGTEVLKAAKKEITLTVHNDGKEFEPSEQMARTTSQMGLRVMREMALSGGGDFTIDSGQGRGTTVRLRLPIADCGMGNAD